MHHAIRYLVIDSYAMMMRVAVYMVLLSAICIMFLLPKIAYSLIMSGSYAGQIAGLWFTGLFAVGLVCIYELFKSK